MIAASVCFPQTLAPQHRIYTAALRTQALSCFTALPRQLRRSCRRNLIVRAANVSPPGQVLVQAGVCRGAPAVCRTSWRSTPFLVQEDEEQKKIEALEESLKKSGLDRARAQEVRHGRHVCRPPTLNRAPACTPHDVQVLNLWKSAGSGEGGDITPEELRKVCHAGQLLASCLERRVGQRSWRRWCAKRRTAIIPCLPRHRCSPSRAAGCRCWW